MIGLAVLPILYPILRAVFGRLAGAETGRLEGVVEALARLVRESADRSSEDPS